MGSSEKTVSEIFTVDGEPMIFYLRPCKQRANISRLVTSNGGRMTWEPNKNGRCTLFIPGDIISMKDAVSTKFVEDSIECGKLKNVEQYRYIYLKNKEKAPSRVNEHDNHLGDSDFIPKGTVHRRGEYSLEEDLKIIRNVLKHSKNHSINGQRLWEILAQNKIIKRTSQSMKERFLKKILPYLENYSLSDTEKRKLSSLTSMKTRRIMKSLKPTKHTLACLGGSDPYALSTDSEESSTTSTHFNRVTRNQPISQEIDNQSNSQSSSSSSKKSSIAMKNKNLCNDDAVTTRLTNLLELPDAISFSNAAHLPSSPKTSSPVAARLERLKEPETQISGKRTLSDDTHSHTRSMQSAAQLIESLDILPTADPIFNMEPTGIKRLRKSTDAEVLIHSDADLFTSSAISLQDSTDTSETQQKSTDTSETQQKSTDTSETQQKSTDTSETQQKSTDASETQQKSTDTSETQQKSTDTSETQQKSKVTLSTFELPSVFIDPQPSTQNVSSLREFSSLEIINEVSLPTYSTNQENHSEIKRNDSNNVILILSDSDQSSDTFDMQNDTSAHASLTENAGAFAASQNIAAVQNAPNVNVNTDGLSANQPIVLSHTSELFTGLTPVSQIFDDLVSGDHVSSDHDSKVSAGHSLKPPSLATAKSMLQRTGKSKFKSSVNSLSESMEECTMIQSSILATLPSQSPQSNANSMQMSTLGHEKERHLSIAEDDPKSQAGSSWSSLDSALVNSLQGTCVTPPPELSASVPPTVERVNKLFMALSQPTLGEQQNQQLNQENVQKQKAINKPSFDSPPIMERNSEVPTLNKKKDNQSSATDASNPTDSSQPDGTDHLFKITSAIETQYYDCFSQVQTASQQSTNSTTDGSSSWNTCSNSLPNINKDVHLDIAALPVESSVSLESHSSLQKVKLDKPTVTFCDHTDMPGTSTQVLNESNVLCHINKIKQHPKFGELLMEYDLSEHILFALVGGLSGDWVQVMKYLESGGAEGRLWQRSDDDILLNNTPESVQYGRLRKSFTTELIELRKTFLEDCVDFNG